MYIILIPDFSYGIEVDTIIGYMATSMERSAEILRQGETRLLILTEPGLGQNKYLQKKMSGAWTLLGKVLPCIFPSYLKQRLCDI